MKCGGAEVSDKHPNMLITNSQATSDDIIKLAKKMQSMVFDKFAILPQPECQFIGFEKNPLE